MAVAQGPVSQKAGRQDGKVESRIIVVNVGDTGHDNKWQVVQEPSDDRVETSVVDMIDIRLAELLETALPTNKVPDDSESDES